MPDSLTNGILLRPALASDAADIAKILRAAFRSFAWMPELHTPEDDFNFIRNEVLPSQAVTVAEANGTLAGFIATHGEWINHLYLQPALTGQGIGSRLLGRATTDVPVARLYCFQANTGARRFYERHGFVAEVFGDGSGNEEKLPDILYVRRR